MIDDEYGRISSFEAVIEFPEMDALTTGNTFIGEYDEGTHSFVFHLTGVAPDSIGNLLITGYDSQYDNNVVITFVNTTIIY